MGQICPRGDDGDRVVGGMGQAQSKVITLNKQELRKWLLQRKETHPEHPSMF